MVKYDKNSANIHFWMAHFCDYYAFSSFNMSSMPLTKTGDRLAVAALPFPVP